MIDLDEIFELISSHPGNDCDYSVFMVDHDNYRVRLWVGFGLLCGLSEPPINGLSLNDYTYFTIEIEKNGRAYTKGELFELGYTTSVALMSKELFQFILRKIGIKDNKIPDDAGDGE